MFKDVFRIGWRMGFVETQKGKTISFVVNVDLSCVRKVFLWSFVDTFYAGGAGCLNNHDFTYGYGMGWEASSNDVANYSSYRSSRTRLWFYLSSTATCHSVTDTSFSVEKSVVGLVIDNWVDLCTGDFITDDRRYGSAVLSNVFSICYSLCRF